ncbi:hypothetical protein OEA41_008675 [Lepraria neglecta]|uniref:Spo12-like protein n=1 Tax=Lepraria neglecta TaxID=209136 RepID=A0AAD9Z2V8_9LECA|nr:hypothetical protein OEA41_008675 [Lepraria neglecta]
MSSPTKPLASRSTNTSPTKPQPSEKPTSTMVMGNEDANKPKSMEYHRQVLQNRLAEEKSSQVYISPSDTIMSPCTVKLNQYKTKHFMKAKPQSLFAKIDAVKKAEANKSEGDGKDEVA